MIRQSNAAKTDWILTIAGGVAGRSDFSDDNRIATSVGDVLFSIPVQSQREAWQERVSLEAKYVAIY